MKLIGEFMDYYGFAQKYHFSFQARKNQDEIGKQYILCIVPTARISEIIDGLKPEKKKRVCIYGQVNRNLDDKVDKIRVEYISEEEDFNPAQVKFFKYK